MNILIVGSGARENAIAVAMKRSKEKTRLFCCGTSLNPNIQVMTEDYWVGDVLDIEAICLQARKWQIGLAIIGPEAPLERGLADELWRAAIPTIGPQKLLAQIETNKAFARQLMQKYHIPGLPKYAYFDEIQHVSQFLHQLGEGNYVVKANGLMGGKGVRVAGDHLATIADALVYCRELLDLQQTFIIEEKLVGQEFSFMCFCDGEQVIPMPLIQDHKRAYVGDKGPNTGGMGSYSDADHCLPFLSDDDVKQALEINMAVVKALQAEFNQRYIGILYGSFIATAKGVSVIEFNARFGDPEALNVLSILSSDFLNICKSMVTGNLTAEQVEFANYATVCKYVVPEGYPDIPVTDVTIDISAVKNKSHLFLSSVNASDGKIYAAGSRTAAYVGVAESISLAEEIAEKEISAITGPLFHRADIGTELLVSERIESLRRLRES